MKGGIVLLWLILLQYTKCWWKRWMWIWSYNEYLYEYLHEFINPLVSKLWNIREPSFTALLASERSHLDGAGGEDPVPLLPEHDPGPLPAHQLRHRAVQPQHRANLNLDQGESLSSTVVHTVHHANLDGRIGPAHDSVLLIIIWNKYE